MIVNSILWVRLPLVGLCLFLSGDKTKRGVELIRFTQCYDNWAVRKERSVLKLVSLCLPLSVKLGTPCFPFSVFNHRPVFVVEIIFSLRFVKMCKGGNYVVFLLFYYFVTVALCSFCLNCF